MNPKFLKKRKLTDKRLRPVKSVSRNTKLPRIPSRNMKRAKEEGRNVNKRRNLVMSPLRIARRKVIKNPSLDSKIDRYLSPQHLRYNEFQAIVKTIKFSKDPTFRRNLKSALSRVDVTPARRKVFSTTRRVRPKIKTIGKQTKKNKRLDLLSKTSLANSFSKSKIGSSKRNYYNVKVLKSKLTTL